MTGSVDRDPLRTLLLETVIAAHQPLSLSELETAADSGGFDSTMVRKRLQGLCESGILAALRGQRYGRTRDLDLIIGRVDAHVDGYGFVLPDDGSTDLYLSPRQMRRVLHDDRVLARVRRIDGQGRREGVIVDLLGCSTSTILGYFQSDGAGGFVTPQDERIAQEIHVKAGDKGGASNGQLVVAELTDHPFSGRHVFARITEILGAQSGPGLATEIAIRKHQLPWQWPDAVAEELAQIAAQGAEAAGQAHADLSDLPFVTIDGSDARDFDDAVFAQRKEGGYRLFVAIADVSHFVKPGSVLDRCAVERGNSAYFPDRVIPMLPEVLSTDLCSLRPHKRRLAVVCEMVLDDRGGVISWRFTESVICSKLRLTYAAVGAYIDNAGSASSAGWPVAVRQSLDTLIEIYQLLAVARKCHGGVNFEFPQARIEYADDGTIEALSVEARNEATRLIEECMLVANVCAARTLNEHLSEAIYRIHEAPALEDVTDLRRILSGFGLKLRGGSAPTAADFAGVVSQAQAKTRAQVTDTLQVLMLRAMKQARYAAQPQPHFALGFAHYTHFTSPIRRYPDLMVHRLLKVVIGLSTGPTGCEKPGTCAEVADHCSVTDRRAEEATREVLGLLKAQFMRRYIGEEFDGLISGVTAFGVFVQLPQFLVDGLVHISELGDDYFHFDPERLQLTGERSGQRIALGDPLRVQVAGVRPDLGQIDFQPVGRQAGGRGLRAGRKSRKSAASVQDNDRPKPGTRGAGAGKRRAKKRQGAR